ncbi:NAD(P)-binding protein [Aaosphaeria arxii CBS 175.79]|uniref:NAD(P)-binding protein n=1 Tax=Aaosphaeria arxii CBS 175.79 TaxID=1450172 RepID=A0A6A5XWH2_9PLEO|nr:NAD(P)-binding protein [Aaosphaeria arxii CBS 175.79]KAF2016980.1 NAD(P)-binding protein [Aaosphaeria arxii CBS 175.79]
MPSWVIVGASRGIGYQYLKTLSADESNIVIGIVRNPDPTKQKVEKDGLRNVHIIAGDLNSHESLNAAAKATSSITNGVVDHLIINGAYLSFDGALENPTDFIGKEDMFRDSLNKAMETNTAGLLYAANAFLPLVEKSEIKKVIYISTGHAHPDAVSGAGFANFITYSLSKVAANFLILKYAEEFKNKGVIFLSLSPGWVLTQVDEEGNGRCNGPSPPEENVRKMIEVIDAATIADSGQFVSHNVGRPNDWF